MNFAKTFWAALLAFVVGNIVLVILSVFFFAMMIAVFVMSLGLGQMRAPSLMQNTVLKIDLSDEIVDAPVASPFGIIDLTSMRRRHIVTVLQAVDAIDFAAGDDRIAGIYLEPGRGSASLSNLEEIRSAILRFKESGKFVVSYADFYMQRDYYLCSTADRVYMNPQGQTEWRGMASSILFYKGMLDKLGVEAQVVRHGTFKAAVEPFVLDRMSPENRLQMNNLVGSIWGSVVGEIAASRGLEVDQLQQYASTLAIDSPQEAVEKGLVDSLLYRPEAMALLNERLGRGSEDDDPPMVSLADYIPAVKQDGLKFTKNRIAVIYADGDIMDGDLRDQRYVGSVPFSEKLASVRRDETVKGVVVRINSPGGSALASEVIWHQMSLLQQEKPVVVSMGGTAASGGYYIAAPADIILANRTTVTGSIGVFGLLFNAEKGLRDKLGITVDVARTNPSADLGSPFRPLRDRERAYLMSHIGQTYDTFVRRVADGRNMSVESVERIAEGRVWAAPDALEIGLIDGFGGLKDAIKLAADRAGIPDTYSVYQVGDKEPPIFLFWRSLLESRESGLRTELGDAYAHVKALQSILALQGVQARMPYTLDME